MRQSSTPAMLRLLLLSAVAAVTLPATTLPASAHPHVWIAVEATVNYENGTITSLHERWIFDEFFTAQSIEGLDTNNDGITDRNELAELAKVSADGLQEYHYFTYARLADEELKFDAPKEFWYEMTEIEVPPGPPDPNATTAPAPAVDAPPKPMWERFTDQVGSWWAYLLGGGEDAASGGPNGPPDKIKVLTYNFTLPLQQPVLAEAEGFEFSVQDPTFFFWYDMAEKNPVRLAGAPTGCKFDIGRGADAADLQSAMSRAFDGQLGSGGSSIAGPGKVVTVSCPKP